MSPTRCLLMWLVVPAVMAGALAPLSAGEGITPPPAPGSRPGVVLLVEGIGGTRRLYLCAALGFRQVGLPHEIRSFNWGHGPGRFFKDLLDFPNIQAKSVALAAEIRELLERDPELRIFLVAHSAGTGIAVRAAELLPPGSLERIVLLSSALSPNYDLCPALAATRGGIVSFHSKHDTLILHWGTSKLGTVDRCYTASAGCVGFDIPPVQTEADAALYRKLVQIPWHPRMRWEGNWGTHTGSTNFRFLAEEVAPLLK